MTTTQDFQLRDTSGQLALYCPNHNMVFGSDNHNHDDCPARPIMFSEFWERTSV